MSVPHYPHPPDLLPLLYAETNPHPELIRTVEMGPFKHQVDSGLDARKVCCPACFLPLSDFLSAMCVRHAFCLCVWGSGVLLTTLDRV